MRSGFINGASWLTTDRHGGVSQGAFTSNNLADHVGDDPTAVGANRSALANRCGVAEVTFVRAAHSDRAIRVQQVGEDVTGADALVTDQPGLALAALGADCVMLGLAGSDGWIAVVHCGWRGLADEVVPATLRLLQECGCDVESLEGHIGPSICKNCYPVGPDRVALVEAVAPTAIVKGDAGWAIDVRTGVLEQLQVSGVTATYDPRCTAEDPDLYSHRRDGVTGRQALVMVGDRHA